jgi:hypothetical protein
VAGDVTILTQTPGNSGSYAGSPSIAPPSSTDTAYDYLYGYGGAPAGIAGITSSGGFPAMMAIAFY